MSAIDSAFQRLKAEGNKGFIPYLTMGDPSLEASIELVLEMARRGADVIEIGAPFSDPLADGPTVQASQQRALANGVNLASILDAVEVIRKQSDVPMILFTYYNPAYQYGLEKLVDRMRDIGLDGALMTDLPPDEEANYKRLMDDRGLDTVFLVAPTSRDDRIKLIAEATTGFVYYISRAGVTGEQATLSDTLGQKVANIKSFTDKPVAVGFGISTPEQSAAVGEVADAVVVGSAIVRRIGEKGGHPDLVPQIGDFVESLLAPLKGMAKAG